MYIYIFLKITSQLSVGSKEPSKKSVLLSYKHTYRQKVLQALFFPATRVHPFSSHSFFSEAFLLEAKPARRWVPLFCSLDSYYTPHLPQ